MSATTITVNQVPPRMKNTITALTVLPMPVTITRPTATTKSVQLKAKALSTF